jgi:RimJ/RimL family protein N-acetyltransferase
VRISFGIGGGQSRTALTFPRHDPEGEGGDPRGGTKTSVSGTDQIVVLRDGTRALIRPIEPGDRERLNEGFRTASPDSIFRRFLTPHPRLSSSQLDYLTAIDHVRHEALIAVDPDTGKSFGTARYIRSEEDPRTAEFAIGIGDRWMRIGLGTALLEALIARAREAGIVRFTGVMQPDNVPVKRLLQKVLGPYETTALRPGEQEIAIDLRPRE